MEENSHTSKSAVMSAIIAGKIASIFGWIVTAFFALVFFIGLSTKDDGSGGKGAALVIVFFVVVCGVLFIAYGKKTKDRIKRFRQYVGIISSRGVLTVEEVAGTVHKPVNFVMQDIQNMIKRRYFVGARVDLNTHNIEFGDRPAGTFDGGAQRNAAPGAVMEAVACKSCGANNQIARGTTGTCEYCGSPIKAE
ncbi:MAG: hypothetical protein P4M02_01925 [Clostridia bacterium]|nr:hypothetical protein [Clostridia bacterium]